MPTYATSQLLSYLVILEIFPSVSLIHISADKNDLSFCPVYARDIYTQDGLALNSYN